MRRTPNSYTMDRMRSLAIAVVLGGLTGCGGLTAIKSDGGISDGGSVRDAAGQDGGSQDGSPPGGGSDGGQMPPSSGGCPIFPADNAWNQDISSAPVDPMSDAYIKSIGASTGLHPDFDAVGDGIPFTSVAGTQALVPITFDYDDQSDPGPYPIPDDAPVEKASDHHVLVIDRDHCKLYELWSAEKSGQGWKAGSGAKWDLTSNAMRPEGWTSADAAGLPVYPGLVRYDEVMVKGEINHALRFTASDTQAGYVAPASHFASSKTDPKLPPMGLRVRLKSSVDISGYPPPVQVILKAMKKYGMILADNGSSWFVSGEPSAKWDDDMMSQLHDIKGSDFEVIKHGPIGKKE